MLFETPFRHILLAAEMPIFLPVSTRRNSPMNPSRLGVESPDVRKRTKLHIRLFCT
jgi:hypothetical protein